MARMRTHFVFLLNSKASALSGRFVFCRFKSMAEVNANSEGRRSIGEVSEDTLNTRRGEELFPHGPKRPLNVEMQTRKVAKIQDGVDLDGGRPRNESRRFPLFGFEDESDEDYDELGSMERENWNDAIHQEVGSFGSRNFGQADFSFASGVGATPTATVTSGALSDASMFDPLAEEAEAGNILSNEQCEFLKKYFVDPSFLPGFLTQLCEERPIPDLVKQGVRKPLDPEILDLMQDNLAGVMKGQDKGLLSTGVRLGSALGPLCELWTNARDCKAKGQDLNPALTARLVEETLIALGQVNAAILFNRRKNLLSKFMRSGKKAARLVSQNHKAFQSETELLFGEVFHEALYKKAKGSQHLREVRKEFNPQARYLKRGRGRGRMFRRSPLVPPMQTQEAHYEARPTATQTSAAAKTETAKPFRAGPSLQGKRGGRGSKSARGDRYVCLSLSSKYNFFGRKRRQIFWQHRSGKYFRNSTVYDVSSTGGRSGGRQSPETCSELADHYGRQLGNSSSEGMSNRVDPDSRADVRTQTPTILKPRIQLVGYRGTQTCGKSSSRSGSRDSRSVCRVPLPTTEKRWDDTTSVQLETPKRICSLRTLQDGGGASSVRHGDPSELIYETGSERCLSVSCNGSHGQEVSQISLEQPIVSVQGLSIRPSLSPTNVHKDPETSDSFITASGNSNGHLPRRYDLCERECRGIANADKFCDMASNPSGVCGKSGEVNYDTDSDHRVFGVSDQCTPNDDIITRRESDANLQRMSGINNSERNNSQTIGKIDRTLSCSSKSSTTGAVTLQEHADVQDQSTTTQLTTLRDQSAVEPGLCERIDMVDGRTGELERSQHHNVSSRSSDHDGCLQKRVGGDVRRDRHTGSLDKTGKRVAYQCVGVDGSQFCGASICEGPEASTHTCESGQYSSSGEHQQNGGNKINRLVESDQRSMGFLLVQHDHDYSGALTGNFQSDCRSSVSTLPRFKQLAVKSGGVQTVGQDLGTNGNGPICRQIKSSDSQVHELETRSQCTRNGCFFDPLEGPSGICLPAILPDREMPSESPERGSNIDHCDPSLEHSTMVQQIDSDGIRLANINPSDAATTDGPPRGDPPTNSEPNTTVSGMAHLRQSWSAGGFSETTCELLGKARRSSTQAVYNSAWKKWTSWCEPREIDPFQASLADIVNFISEFHKLGLEYSTLNGYRAALSTYHPEIDGHKVGQHPVVKQLFTGAFNERPPQPKYAETWDVNMVLTYIQNMEANGALTDKDLTMKTVTLLALAVIGRAHELQSINPKLIEDYGDKLVIRIARLTKTKRPAKADLTFTVEQFEDPKLDVVACIKAYLDRTRSGYTLSLNKVWG